MVGLALHRGGEDKRTTKMKTAKQIKAAIAEHRNELAALHKSQSALFMEFHRGVVTGADYKVKQKALDQSFKKVRNRIERLNALYLYRERTSDEGVEIELERLRVAYKKRKKAATKRAIEDLIFLTN